jgi:transcription termination/antitermination protein NusG
MVELDERGREQVPHWYGAIAISQHEKKVNDYINQMAKMPQWKNQIFESLLPTEKVPDKNGKLRERKLISQTLYIYMILNNDTWSAINSISGLSTTLPRKGTPQPVEIHEMRKIYKRMGQPFHPSLVYDYELGDTVQIMDKKHHFYLSRGTISKLESEKEIATVGIEMLGQTTPIKIDYIQLKTLR